MQMLSQVPLGESRCIAKLRMLTVPFGALGADAPPQFLEEQVAVFMNVLENSAVEGPSLADDLRYQEFLAAGARPALPVRPAGGALYLL